MMGRLVQLIQAAPPLAPASEDPHSQLQRLVLRLAAQTLGPLSPRLSIDQKTPSLAGGGAPAAPLTFGDYVAQAAAIVAQGDLPGQACLALLQQSGFLPPEPRELVADLLRRAAIATGDRAAIAETTQAHLTLLRAWPSSSARRAAIPRGGLVPALAARRAKRLGYDGRRGPRRSGPARRPADCPGPGALLRRRRARLRGHPGLPAGAPAQA